MKTPPLPSNKFKHVPGFIGYAVTDEGELWSCLKRGPGLTFNDRWIKLNPAINNSGRTSYVQVGLSKDKRMYIKGMHRLVLEAFVGPCPPGYETRHLNGNSLDNRLDNLVWGTKVENSADKVRHGTLQSGERNGGAKLTAEQVSLIRKIRPQHTLLQLASMFGVSRAQIKRIVYGQSWK